MFYFIPPENVRKPGFLTFSEGIKWKNGLKWVRKHFEKR